MILPCSQLTGMQSSKTTHLLAHNEFTRVHRQKDHSNDSVRDIVLLGEVIGVVWNYYTSTNYSQRYS